MEIILYVSAAVAAVAFLVLVIFLAKTLKSLQVTLDSVSHTLTGVEKQLQGLTTESTLLLHKTNVLAEDLQKKSDNLNTVVDAVKEVGTTLKGFNHSLQKVSTKVEREVEQNQEKIAQVVQWGTALFELKDAWKRRKSESSNIPSRDISRENEQTALASDSLAKKRFLRSQN